jgi:hypothetical protein
MTVPLVVSGDDPLSPVFAATMEILYKISGVADPSEGRSPASYRNAGLKVPLRQRGLSS